MAKVMGVFERWHGAYGLVISEEHWNGVVVLKTASGERVEARRTDPLRDAPWLAREERVQK